MRQFLSCLGTILALAFPAAAQETGDATRVRVAFHEASIDAVLHYVSQVTGWTFILEAPARGTITATGDADIPLSQVLAFLDACLRPHDLVVLNPAAPRAPGRGAILRVLDLSTAARANADVHVGIDPRDIPLTGEPRVQILPLKSANAAETGKDFGDVFRRMLGDGGQLAISAYSNAILASGPSEGVHRVAEILSVIEQTASVQLKLDVFPLEYTDAVETAKILNDVFRREAPKGDPIAAPRLPGFFRGTDPGPAPPKSPAYEVVKITPDPRSNALVAGATEENMAVIRRLLAQLDRPSAALNTYIVRLVNSDATTTAALINSLLHNPTTSSIGGPGGTPRSEGTPASGQALPGSPLSSPGFGTPRR